MTPEVTPPHRLRDEVLREAMRAVVAACGPCEGQGWTVGVGTENGHQCDGTDEMCQQVCPVPIAVEVQEPCEYCGRPTAAIAALLSGEAQPASNVVAEDLPAKPQEPA